MPLPCASYKKESQYHRIILFRCDLWSTHGSKQQQRPCTAELWKFPNLKISKCFWATHFELTTRRTSLLYNWNFLCWNLCMPFCCLFLGRVWFNFLYVFKFDIKIGSYLQRTASLYPCFDWEPRNVTHSPTKIYWDGL